MEASCLLFSNSLGVFPTPTNALSLFSVLCGYPGFVSVTVIKENTPTKTSQGRESLFGLQFQVAVYQSQEPKPLVPLHPQSKTERRECTRSACFCLLSTGFPILYSSGPSA